jgi:hypothetical protein
MCGQCTRRDRALSSAVQRRGNGDNSACSFRYDVNETDKSNKDTLIAVTGRRGPYSLVTSGLPLDNGLTDGGEVSLTRRPPFTLQDDSKFSFVRF